jgi:UDP-N-acetylglucosamine acyltransferase
VVGDGVSIGARTKLLSHVVVNGDTTIGVDSVAFPFCSIGLP